MLPQPLFLSTRTFRQVVAPIPLSTPTQFQSEPSPAAAEGPPILMAGDRGCPDLPAPALPAAGRLRQSGQAGLSGPVKGPALVPTAFCLVPTDQFLLPAAFTHSSRLPNPKSKIANPKSPDAPYTPFAISGSSSL
jgi:hypothetical protein